MRSTPRRVDELLRLQDEARERRQRKDPQGAFLALHGLDTAEATFVLPVTAGSSHLGDELRLEHLEAPPAIFGTDLTRSLRPRHQLCLVGADIDHRASWILDGVFWTSVALLRLATSGFFVVCEFANRSWDVIDGYSELENVETFMPGSGTHRPAWWPQGLAALDADNWVWVTSSVVRVVDLRANERFHFALDAFTGSFEEQDARMATSKVWAGIEGLFAVNAELRFRLATYIATLLEPPGDARLELHRQVLSLYDSRSKVVHGASIKRQALIDQLLAAQDILRRLLRDSIENNAVRTTGEIEASLFGSASPS